MSAVLTVGLVAVVVSEPLAQAAPVPLRLERDTCPQPRSGEIVVCGRREEDRHRLGPAGLPAGGTPWPGPPGLNLGDDVRADLDIHQIVRTDGWVDRRIMLRIRIGF